MDGVRVENIAGQVKKQVLEPIMQYIYIGHIFLYIFLICFALQDSDLIVMK